MTIEVTAYAPSRAVGLALMQSCGIAEEQNGALVPLVDVQITSTDDGWRVGAWTGEGEDRVFTPRDGMHVNYRFYGRTAEALCAGGDAESSDLFERAPGLLQLFEAAEKPLSWAANSNDTTPPGYENADGFRITDPSLIATRANGWA